jgi:hypothetical protein
VIALQGRPIRVTCVPARGPLVALGVVLYEQNISACDTSAALSGRILNPRSPRAKALGCSLKPFHGVDAIQNAKRGAHATTFFSSTRCRGTGRGKEIAMDFPFAVFSPKNEKLIISLFNRRFLGQNFGLAG